jgi:polar amino acid transport system permease protein
VAFVTAVVLLQTDDLSLASYEPYRGLIEDGIRGTIFVSIVSLFGSLLLGFILYLFSVSKIKYLNALTDIFTEIIYGTPLLVMVIVMVFLIGPSFVKVLQFEVFASIGLFDRLAEALRSREWLGILSLIVYMAPYMKNVYKSAFSSITEEQYMAMDLFGFTPYQRYRYLIIPQVVRILMPPLMNNFSMIIKGSALLSVISYTDLFYSIKIAQSRTFAFIEGYLLMWVLYLMITIPLSQLTKLVERKWAL